MLEQFISVGGSLLQPLHVPVEDFASGPRVAQMLAGKGQAIEVRPVWLKVSQVGLREMNMLWVERLKVAIEELAGHYSVERLLHIVVVGQHVRGRGGDLRRQSGPDLLGERRW